MKANQKGFTLIELIIVIVILGALAVVALPRFIDLQDEARQAATDGVAGSLAAGTATNFAGFVAGSADAVQVESCGEAEDTLQGQALPAGYTINDDGFAAGTADSGDTGDCELVNPDDTSITTAFQAYRVNGADL